MAPFIALYLRDPTFFERESIEGIAVYGGVSLFASIASLAHFSLGRGVSRYFSLYDANQIAKACLAAVVLTSAICFSVTRLELIPRSLPLIHFLVLGCALTATRFVATKLGQSGVRAGHTDSVQNVVIVGANRTAWHLIRLLEGLEGGHLRIVAIFDDDARLHGRSMSGHPIVGAPVAAESIIEEYATHGVYIQRVVVAKPLDDPSFDLARLRDVCQRHGLVLDDLAERLGMMAAEAKQECDHPSTGTPTRVFDPGREIYWRVKRLLDIAISGSLLLLLAPLFLLAFVLVFLDVGSPMLFWQRRLGYRRRVIHVYKFRTLRLPFDNQGRRITFNDRLSRVGSFLRATRIDELPQLYNIFRGDMSLVGPRPLLPEDQPNDCNRRLAVRPGLTGWAQVHGGKLITSAEKNALDEWYILNCSPIIDAKIILLTIRCILVGDQRNEHIVQDALEVCPTTSEISCAAPLSMAAN